MTELADEYRDGDALARDRRGVVVAEHTEPAAEDVQIQTHLLDVLVHASDTLRDDFDLVGAIDHLIDVCRQLVPSSEVSMVLADEKGTLHLAGGSCERKRVLEQYQIDHGSGPSIETFRTGEEGRHEYVHAEDYPWPHFAQLARAVGYMVIRSIPLRLRDETIGVLSIAEFEDAPRPPLQCYLIRALADGITIGFVNRRVFSAANELSRQLQTALTSRVLIEQAKGVVAARLDLGVNEAFETLRSFARSKNLKLVEVSRGVIDGTLPLEALSRARLEFLSRTNRRGTRTEPAVATSTSPRPIPPPPPRRVPPTVTTGTTRPPLGEHLVHRAAPIAPPASRS